MAVSCIGSASIKLHLLVIAVVAATGACGEETSVVVTTPPELASVASLNSRIFAGNVLKGDWAEHWVVLFCVDWFAPCQQIERSYAAKAAEHQARNAGAVLQDLVRFAKVDCAVDKVLCNEQEVEDYPTVVHYFRNEREDGWTCSGRKDCVSSLGKWLTKELKDIEDTELWNNDPYLTWNDIRCFFRLLAMAACTVALFVWAAGRGTDIWLELLAQRHQHLKRRATSRSLQAVATGRMSRMARSFPREWTTRSMEL